MTALGPELTAFFAFRRRAARLRRWLAAPLVSLAMVAGVFFRAAAHLALEQRLEPHLAAAMELVALGAPLFAVWLALPVLGRWAVERRRPAWLAGLSARHDVPSAVLRELLEEET